MAELIRNGFILKTITPTISAAAYAAGDVIGTVQTVTNAMLDDEGSCSLVDVVLTDGDKQSVAIDLFFFDELPTGIPADNAAFDLAVAQLIKCIGVVSIGAGDYVNLANRSVASLGGIIKTMSAITSSKDIYMILVSRGAPTYTTTSSLTVRLKLYQD